MANETKVTLSRGGSGEKTVPISQVQIPDLWHLAQAVRTSKKLWAGQEACDLILEVWSRAHDLKNHIQET